MDFDIDVAWITSFSNSLSNEAFTLVCWALTIGIWYFLRCRYTLGVTKVLHHDVWRTACVGLRNAPPVRERARAFKIGVAFGIPLSVRPFSYSVIK